MTTGMDGRIAFVTEYRPMTCGGVIFDALFEELRKRVNVEGVAVGPRRLMRASTLEGIEGVRLIGYVSKHFRDFELRMRLRGYALYHFQSLRYAKVAAKRHPSIVTVYDIIPLKGVVPKSEGSKRRMKDRLIWLADVDAVQAISETVKRDLIDLAGIDEGKIHVAHLGVDLNTYRPRDRAEARKELGLPEDALLFLNVGSENKNKNIRRLLQAFETVLTKFPDALLVRVGRREPEITSSIEEMGLAGSVIRTGEVAQTPHLYYNAADVYVCADIEMGFGMPNLEAMASGCPVATSRNGAAPEVVGDAAVTFDPLSTDEMAAALLRLAEDEKLRRELAEAGLRRAKQFSWAECAGKTITLYKKLLQQGI